jgi:ubiquinone/menaquinone biosynthesis C-methylase UbiE
MLDLASQRLLKQGARNFELAEGNAVRLPFQDAEFDLVFMVTVLGETPDPARAVSEIARVLKPGGRLSVTEQLGDPDHVRRGDLDRFSTGAGLVLERRSGSVLLYTAVFRRPLSHG